jgi:serine/threonine protein kinase
MIDEARNSTAAIDPAVSQDGTLLLRLFASKLLLNEDWERLPARVRNDLLLRSDEHALLAGLVEYGLMTAFQAKLIKAGRTFGLVLGDYRLLERLGSGGMGTVYKAEHTVLRKIVAIKVVRHADVEDPSQLRRFTAEMRTVAQLHHPNIVAATDAGHCVEPGANGQTLFYFVMDYVPGTNLEALVKHGGPMDPAIVCDIGHQIASALAEANKRDLVHRDIKPSNIIYDSGGTAKLLDFGLARNLLSRETRQGMLLGTIDYMSPEQASDSSDVDIRTDIFSLGATLYWCLTGRRPFERKPNAMEAITLRRTQPSPRVRERRPEVSPELEDVIAGMMATAVEDRIQSPQELMQELLPFLPSAEEEPPVSRRPLSVMELVLNLPHTTPANSSRRRVLIVDDEPPIRALCRAALESPDIECDEAADGIDALAAVRTLSYDAIILDLRLPKMEGREVCRRLRESANTPHQKILVISGCAPADDLAEMLADGVDDFLTKPLSVVQLQARVRAALRLKDQQENADRLNKSLVEAKGPTNDTAPTVIPLVNAK